MALLKLKQTNPWIDFEYSDFMVHPWDLNAFESHNAKAGKGSRFIPFLTPEPWIGCVKSSVVVLLANPGATKENLQGEREANPARIDLSIRNLHMDELEYPHYFLDPRLQDDPGGKWWRRSLGTLIKQTSLRRVASNILSLESIPYHSNQFEAPDMEIPTQEYTNQILRDAIERDAFIIVYRQPDFWLSQVPELIDHVNKTMYPNTTQSVWITPGNLKNGFDQVVSRL